jgi:hypothetical protein
MSDVLNTPERTVDNISAACRIMRAVDGVLGDERLQEFAVGVSRILSHTQPSGSGLCSVVSNKDARLEVFKQVFNSATELQTAWNCLRLANVPASQRQGRVAMELIGIAIVFSVPVSILLEGLSTKDPLAKWLGAHPGKTAIDAYKPPARREDEPDHTGPAVLATQFFNSFLDVAEVELQIPADAVRGIRDYRRAVQHPASHGSAELSAYHFETLVSGAAGALFDPERADTYVEAADDLTQIAHLLADILDWATHYLATR